MFGLSVCPLKIMKKQPAKPHMSSSITAKYHHVSFITSMSVSMNSKRVWRNALLKYCTRTHIRMHCSPISLGRNSDAEGERPKCSTSMEDCAAEGAGARTRLRVLTGNHRMHPSPVQQKGRERGHV